MVLINKIFNNRLTDKLSLKSRYERFKYIPYKDFHNVKFLYDLDKIKYCIISLFLGNYEYYNYKNGFLHRDDDKNGNPMPAYISCLKNKFYYKEGKFIKEHY
jgi:hypothetical protein